MLRSSAEWVVRGLPPVYASRSPAPLTRGRRWRAAPNRGFCLPAPSGAPMASTPSGGERREVVSGNRSRGDSARDAGGEGRSRGACGQSVTGVRSGGRTPGRVAERWPSEAETPERRAHTPRAASPGGYEAAPRRQRRRRGGEEREAIWRRGGTEPRSVRAVSNRGSERREDAGTRSGAVAERGGDPGEESPHTTRGESRRVRGRAKASAQGGARRRGQHRGVLRRPGLARAADLACSAARPNGGRLSPYPGLRVTLPCPADAWQAVACHSEPGIPSARPLRGSESVNAIRRGEERGSQREP